MSKIGWLNNRRYNLPEDLSFLLNDLDAKDEEIARLRAEVKSLSEKTQYWPDNAERDAVICYQKAEIERLRAALEGK